MPGRQDPKWIENDLPAGRLALWLVWNLSRRVHASFVASWIGAAACLLPSLRADRGCLNRSRIRASLRATRDQQQLDRLSIGPFNVLALVYLQALT